MENGLLIYIKTIKALKIYIGNLCFKNQNF